MIGKVGVIVRSEDKVETEGAKDEPVQQAETNNRGKLYSQYHVICFLLLSKCHIMHCSLHLPCPTFGYPTVLFLTIDMSLLQSLKRAASIPNIPTRLISTSTKGKQKENAPVIFSGIQPTGMLKAKSRSPADSEQVHRM